MYKEFLSAPALVAPVYRKYLDTRSLVSINELARTAPSKYKVLVQLLQDKGVSTTILEPLGCTYNTVDDRLVFRFNGVDLGRDCTGRSEAKWLKYYRDDSECYVYLQGKKVHSIREPEFVIVCEDLFSCAKVTWYTQYSTMCLLGTRFEDKKLQFFTKNRVAVVLTDGDQAGWDCSSMIKQRCDLFDIPCIVLRVPDGCDPKDLKPQELLNLTKCLELHNG